MKKRHFKQVCQLVILETRVRSPERLHFSFGQPAKLGKETRMGRTLDCSAYIPNIEILQNIYVIIQFEIFYVNVRS